MANRFALIALFGVLLVPSASPFTATAQAQVSASCGKEIAKQEAAMRQYDTDAKKAGVGFLANDVGNAALGKIRKDLEGDPTADALADMEQRYKEYSEAVERGANYKAVFDRLVKCLAPTGAKGCLNEIIAQSREISQLRGRVNDAMSEWIKSLGNDSISKAVERVEEARSVTENLGKSAGNMAMDAANGALKNCFNDMKQRVDAQKDAVDLRKNLPKGPTGTEKGGGEGPSAGKVIAVTSVLAAGTIAAIVYIPQLVESASAPDCSSQKSAMTNSLNSLVNAVNNLSACGSNVTCLTSRQGAVTSATSSIANTAGNYCSCLGVGSAASAEEKADFQRIAAAAGVSPGNFPSCMR